MSQPDDNIQRQLLAAAERQDDWHQLGLVRCPQLHVAVMSEPFLSAVFTGKKTVESRFSLHRIAPYQRVLPSDIVLMKAGPIVGCFRVAWVKYFDLAKVPIDYVAATYGQQINATPAFWRQKTDKRYATLMGIEQVQRLSPLRIYKTDRRGWLTIEVAAPTRS